MRAADIVVMLYRDSSAFAGFDLSLAMALGKAIISTEITYAREILGRSNRRGIVVPIEDPESLSRAISNLLANPS